NGRRSRALRFDASWGRRRLSQANPKTGRARFIRPWATLETFLRPFGRTHMTVGPRFSRRDALRALALSALPVWPRLGQAQARTPIIRTIPASGEALPAVGVGSWITFNVPPDTAAAGALVPVLSAFFERGGTM